ncbi:GAF domain-containing protein [Deinococcus sp. HMF7620]|uniref:histidine kinase n=1 Tax=Deinococcus arboris TaxID=2682977 RepID=A0A7C9LR75_9DEIO|nr:ATP-binding protein [Deinococcus arboris]MVN87161.1 GAF domain-containing protein [Deinococcus arboris]
MSEAFADTTPRILQHLTETLAAARTQTAVLEAALSPTITALGAVSGTVLLLESKTQELAVRTAQGLAAHTLWQDGPLTPDTPVGDAIIQRQALYFEHPGDLKAAYPHLEDQTGGLPAAATAILPLSLDEQVLGVLLLDFRQPHQFTADEQCFLSTIAAQTALGLDRATLLKRLDGEGAQRQLQARTQELETDRAFLSTTLNSLGEAIIVCDAQGHLIRFDGLAAEMHGQDAEPIDPEQWASQYNLYLSDCSRPLNLAEVPLYRAWQGEEVQNVEFAICRPGHPPRYVVANGQPLFTPDGRPNGAVVAQRDITTLHVQSQQLSERTTELERQRAALRAEQAASRAFVTFTEAAGRTQTVEELGHLAMTTLHVILPGVTALFYERAGATWMPLAWTPDIAPDLLTVLQRGLPADTPILVQMTTTRQPVFLDGGQEEAQGVAHTAAFHSVAAYPVMQGGNITALLSLGLPTQAPWTDAQRELVLALGRSFTLLHDRLSVARQVQEQRDAAEKRSEALEAFAVMSRDLAGETNRYALVRRAQEIMLSLLTPGYALYWEQASDHWELKSQVGDIGNPELQQLVDDYGLPLDAPALHSTWQTGIPNYQDNYAQGADTPIDMIRHVNAATAFRVVLHGQPIGMLAIGLFDQRVWTPMDRAVLETAIYSLGLVLERAQSIEALEQANTELQIANEELHAFTYSVSHDLRTPVRHVKGFTELAMKTFTQGQTEKAQRHLGIVSQAADRMTEMIDAMLALSRAGRVELLFRPVPLQTLVQQAQQDAMLEFPEQPVDWQIGPLPAVRADTAALQQVLTNLLSNAVKFAALTRPLQVRVWAEEQPQAWAVFVQDTGVGFDQEYAGKLFGVFQRLHTQDQFAGTGVGLATIKRIVTRHGGQVWAEGRVDAGATFGFTLPKGP